MAPDNKCRVIVRTIPGRMTGGDDDIYVCADGSAWQRLSYDDSNSTTGAAGAFLHGNKVCDHK